MNTIANLRRAASLVGAVLVFALAPVLAPQESGSTPKAKPRARDQDIPFDGAPGTFNSITDVAGVETGYTTQIAGESKRMVGQGPVRTGVTAVFPRGKASSDAVFATFIQETATAIGSARIGSKRTGF